ncbi:uncharacterized protein LOC133193546 [Saccostrea echinata]|uniref:uncharacterized protein LOC133193546 n=1 Tax=Saccostrea echinata TaxID=191078 RepID=UPI002A812830|nr:uncharacterized protein LOC133193546 [Saccostrea echinata]
MDGSEDNKNCAPEEKTNHCDVCSRQNLKANGCFWCVDCSDMLCTKCRDIHNSIRSTMKHEVLAKSKISSSKVFRRNLFCEDHSDRKLEVYCFDHEKPCCLMCATITHRKCDRVEILEKCAKSVKTEDVDSLLESFKKLRKGYITKQEKERENHSEFKSSCSQIATDIKGKSGKMILHIQNEQELLQDLSNIEKSQNEEFEKKREMFEETSKIISQNIDVLTDVKSLSIVNMFLETNKCKKLHTYLNDDYAKRKSPDEKYSVSLELHSFVVNFDTTFTSFGRCTLNGKRGQVNLLEDSLEMVSRISCKDSVTDLEIIDENYIIVFSQTGRSVHLYNIDGSHKASIQFSSELWAISRWGENFAVACRGDNSIRVLSVTFHLPGLSLDRSIQLDYKPSGVAEKGEDLLVLCGSKMLKITKAGNISVLFKITSDCSYGFCCATRDAILFTDPNNSGQLYCMKNREYFQNLFERKYPEVKHPCGVATDSKGNIYLVGFSSATLVQLYTDGTFVRTLIKNHREVIYPHGVRIYEDVNSVKLFLATGNIINVYTFTRLE